MRGEGIQRIQLSDKKKKKRKQKTKKTPTHTQKKRHNELSDGGTRTFYLVSKVHNKKYASTN